MSLRRASVTVPSAVAEVARCWMMGIFPEGFEEVERGDELELAAYTDDDGAERLRQRFGAVAVADVPDDWHERWRAFHRPVRIGPLWVGPPWAADAAPAEAVSVVIDPGRAFGTGAHATTRSCLELLAGVPTGSVLDIGCGSGVLSIAAARLGHRPVVAVDNDPAAVEATQDNARANGVELDVRLADALTDALPETDLAVANASFAAAHRLAARLNVRRFIASGYFATAQPELEGFAHRDRREREGWAADLFERTE